MKSIPLCCVTSTSQGLSAVFDGGFLLSASFWVRDSFSNGVFISSLELDIGFCLLSELQAGIKVSDIEAIAAILSTREKKSDILLGMKSKNNLSQLIITSMHPNGLALPQEQSNDR
ncbi:MAG: hypothetical protein GWP27_07775 [Bacteroidetes bacterium]|nr:hypothetical protein [Bacteroidota bacterium]